MTRLAPFLRHQLPALLWAGALFISSSIPSDRVPEIVGRFWDKLLHAAAFGLLALLLLRAFRHQAVLPFLRRHAAAAAVIATALYGVSDEFHQLFVAGRHSSVGDVAADAVGAVLVVAAAEVFRRSAGRVASPSGNR